MECVNDLRYWGLISSHNSLRVSKRWSAFLQVGRFVTASLIKPIHVLLGSGLVKLLAILKLWHSWFFLKCFGQMCLVRWCIVMHKNSPPVATKVKNLLCKNISYIAFFRQTAVYSYQRCFSSVDNATPNHHTSITSVGQFDNIFLVIPCIWFPVNNLTSVTCEDIKWKLVSE